MSAAGESIPQNVRDLVYQSRFSQGSIRDVAALLPPSAEELDAWLAASLAASDQILFIYLAVATAAAQRPFPARHLARGLGLFGNDNLVGWFVCQALGAVDEAVLLAIEKSMMAQSCEAHALFALALWCRDHREGKWPAGLLAAARGLARQKGLKVDAKRGIVAVAIVTADPALASILGSDLVVKLHQPIENVVKAYAKTWHGPIFDLIPATPARELASGSTMRRSVPRIRRNQMCPCGSGKKYKNCCEKIDQERLHHSSEVAGKTREELA